MITLTSTTDTVNTVDLYNSTNVNVEMYMVICGSGVFIFEQLV